MLASINPLGERARNRRWGITVAAYLLGSLAAAAPLGALLGLIGAWLHHLVGAGPLVVAGGALAACALGAAFDLGIGGLRLPTVHRQVDKDMLDEYRGWVYGLSFGFQLGLGVVTVVNTASIYVTLVLAFLSGSALTGLVIGATFGLVRAMVILSVWRVRHPEQLRQTYRRLQSWGPLSRRAGVGVQALMVLTIGAATVGR
jgi:hypothetical protein